MVIKCTSAQVHLSSSLRSLQQAVASSHAAIGTLCTAGLAEQASTHVLSQAEVHLRPQSHTYRSEPHLASATAMMAYKSGVPAAKLQSQSEYV